MSQKLKISGYRLSGRPYTGIDDTGTDRYAAGGLEAAEWLANASRTRFNQQRSLRSKYVYLDGEQVLDSGGKPALAPIGATESRFTNAEARREFSYLSAVPAMVLHYQVRDEDRSWWAGVKRRTTNWTRGQKAGAMPSFKTRHHTALTFGCFANNGASPVVVFAKTGKRSGIIRIGGINPTGKTTDGQSTRWSLTIRVRLPKHFDTRPFTSIQVNVTAGTLTLVNPPLPIKRTPTGSIAGIDVGVAVNVATSGGAMYHPAETTRLQATRKRSQQKMARSRLVALAEHRNFWESRRYQNHKATAAAASAKIARIRTDWRHKTTTTLIRDHDYIAIEDLSIKSMMASAAGTIEAPGKNVRQKAGLNRGLADMSAGALFAQLRYKAALTGVHLTGVHLVEVPAHYTSQRCHQCGHIAAENRETQSDFACTHCGHTDNADTNAALNILARAQRTWDGTRPKQVRG